MTAHHRSHGIETVLGVLVSVTLLLCLHHSLHEHNLHRWFQPQPSSQFNIINEQLQDCKDMVQMELCGCNRTVQLARCPQQGTNINKSSCSSWATLRGPGQKVVSFSVYGKFPNVYHRGLEKCVREVAEMYPGWIMRVYINWTQGQQRDWACDLACNNAHLDLCDVQNLPGIGDVSKSYGMAWRFSVMGDPLVDRYIVRDADSIILQREVDAVNQWIDLGRCYHVMRDHPFHGVSMLGGMWGGCNSWQPHQTLHTRANLLTASSSKFNDQQVLWKYLWPWAKKNLTAHDSFFCQRFPGSLPFPSRRVNHTFVAMPSYRFPDSALNKQCSKSCRPKLHMDWKMC